MLDQVLHDNSVLEKLKTSEILMEPGTPDGARTSSNRQSKSIVAGSSDMMAGFVDASLLNSTTMTKGGRASKNGKRIS